MAFMGAQRPTKYTAVATAIKLKKPCQLSKNDPDEIKNGPISISIICYLCMRRSPISKELLQFAFEPFLLQGMIVNSHGRSKIAVYSSCVNRMQVGQGPYIMLE